MSREIKFRAWNIVENKMWSHEIMERNKHFALDAGLPHHDFLVYPNGDHIVLMQYTGLKDKNAKEIYDGDLLLIKIRDFNTGKVIASETCEVMFKGDRFGVKFGNAQEFTGLCDFSNTTFEVVGNVYESKE